MKICFTTRTSKQFFGAVILPHNWRQKSIIVLSLGPVEIFLRCTEKLLIRKFKVGNFSLDLVQPFYLFIQTEYGLVENFHFPESIK